jgi:hypothetical protein
LEYNKYLKISEEVTPLPLSGDLGEWRSGVLHLGFDEECEEDSIVIQLLELDLLPHVVERLEGLALERLVEVIVVR